MVCEPQTFLNCHKQAGLKPPKLVHSETAECTPEACSLRLENSTVLALIIDENGKPRNISVVHSFADHLPPGYREVGLKMDNNAMKAVQSYRFKPGTLDNHAVPVQTMIVMNFHCCY
jgi:periplasmic protein TonB